MTVSNAFNRPDQLSSELRQRVLDRASKMGYSGPDAIARHLRSGKTNTYAVVFEEDLSYAFSDPFSVAWLTAFAEVMQHQHASIMILSATAAEPESLQAIQDAAVDGVAGLCGNQPAIAAARARGLPTVYCSMSEWPSGDGDYVVIDDYSAGHDIGAHLHRLGHRRVVMVHEAMYPGQSLLTEQPVEDFARALDQHRYGFYRTLYRARGIVDGLAGAQISVVVTESNSRDSGRGAGAIILDRKDRPTAVVGVSDVLALGVMDACAQRGLAPGIDISIAGFDDVPEAITAGLTTIRQPVRDKGRIAAELLLDPERPERRITLPHELIVRSSTRPVA
jgi:DNA-binding LacI/PurR family transcriptional regulator